MPNLAAISQATTEINRGGWIPPPQALTVSNRPGEIGLSYFDMWLLIRGKRGVAEFLSRSVSNLLGHA